MGWKREFTVKEFNSTFISPNPNKVLHDMVRKGFIEKAGWGKYRVNSPQEYVSKKVNVVKAYELVKDAGRRYALTDADAVFFWTKGGYQADRFFGFYPIHIAVRSQELEAWKRFFRAKRQRFIIEKEPVHETMFGVFYVLYPREKVVAEDVEGTSVMSLKKTVEFCRRNIFTYQPALEMLNEMYRLKMRTTKYREVEVNF